ncbi:hypothetical protein HMPREF0762_00634 [Slackia exigua ATCC 700122]|uniref:Uncharacterized protein n=1 Tax=Slackia exigua (strain ATCC 700122 / DSM 15923 / CIP 105133 / JCM 11022 / KCTC 5966 / S-7) TaxID=649764 RepID=D0WFN5_SLAES|nr:hypothetical protein HMPREF0762_00634 [Slackia exigua ATCC 700122]
MLSQQHLRKNRRMAIALDTSHRVESTSAASLVVLPITIFGTSSRFLS